VIDLKWTEHRYSPVRRVARLGVAALAVAALSAGGISGALAQQEDGVYGGDAGTTPVVTGEISPAPSDVGAVPGEDVAVPEVLPSILDGETQVPDVIESRLEDFPVPVQLTAIFGEGFPFSVEDGADGAIAGEINVGGTDGGTMTVGDGGEGGISIGDGGGVYSN